MRLATSRLLLLLCFSFALVSQPLAQEKAQRATVGPGVSNQSTVGQTPLGPSVRLRYAPIALSGGTQLTLISPESWSPLADQLSASLEGMHSYFTELFGQIPAFTTSLRLMNNEVFYQETGAPRWTNAMYYRGQIIIPLANPNEVDLTNLQRSIRHEYTHAVIHAMSAGKCPGWLDEGIAQWAEGAANPALEPALAKWLSKRRPIPLSLLQGGFTKLQSAMVAPAYAQSLFAANTMIQTFGFSQLRGYFDRLAAGDAKPIAFEKNFHLSEHRFEDRLESALKRWTRRSSHSRESITKF